MGTIDTRLATLADLNAIASLFDAYRQFYGQAPDLPAASGFIRHRLQAEDSVILLASSESQSVGFCQLYPLFCSVEAKPIYLLSDLYVVPEARRLGVGRALLLAAERHSLESGRVRMELTTARTNTTAQATYESLGWSRDEIFYTYTKRIEASVPT